MGATYNMMRSRMMLALWALGSAHLAHGDARDVLSEESFFSDLPVVLSGTRLHQPLADTPMAITVIDREMIEASGARKIYDIFRLIPGVQIGAYSGHNQVVTYHGLSDQYSRRMQILIDGRSVYSPIYGDAEWNHLPIALEDIERIEFIRGPNAATYGANAFLGTISIFTRHPRQAQGTILKTTGGEGGIRQVLVQHGGAVGDFGYRMSAEYFADGGFPDVHDSQLYRIFNFHGDYQAGLQDDVEFQFGINAGPRDVGEEPGWIYKPGHIDWTNSFQQLRWHHTVEAGNEYTFQLYHNRESLKEMHTSIFFEPFDDSPTADRLDLEMFNQRIFGSDHRLVWGASIRRDEIHSPVLFGGSDDPQVSRLSRLFGHYEWRLTPSLLLNAGLMWEQNQITGSDLSPRLALNYRIAPAQTLKASVSQANRTPLLFEDRGNLVVQGRPVPRLGFGGGPVSIYRSAGNLRPETITSWEVDYVGQFQESELTLDLRLFRDSIHDLIDAVQITPPPPSGYPSPPLVWDNRSSATLSGVEMSADWRPTPRSRLIFNYSYTEVDSNSRSAEDSVPHHTIGMLALYDILPSLRLSGSYYHLGEMKWLDADSRVDAYDRLDLKMRYSLNKHVQLSLTAQDVLGKHEDYNQRNKADTRVFASIKIDL